MNLQPSICDGFWDIVNVSDIKDVGSFTLRLGGSQEAFGKMMDDVQEVGTNSSTVSTATVGAPVLAQFSFDNQWYRAEITEIHDDGTLTVCYIDYGNMERVKKVNTRANTAFTNLPKQGVECRLHRIDYTKGSISKHQESFRSICLNRTFTALFVSQSSNYIWNVELFHDTGNVNDWFGSQAGVLTAPLVKLPVPSKLPHPHNAGLEPAKVINGVTLDQSERVVPTNFSGTVVYVNNPAQFWLQLASDEEAVMDISAQLAEHCNSSSIKRLNHPVVGQACAALYSEDITWYRGRIEELCGDSAKIYFIDYGNVETVGLDSIAHLPSDLQSIPGYAIEASLHGVESASDHSWTDEESNAFSDIVITCVCEVEVVNEGNEAARQVNLVVQGTPVVNKLVEAGIAKRYPAVPSPVVNGHTQVPPVSHQSTNVYEGGFTRQQVQSGQKELVYISWLVNPANFWVQKANCEGQLAALLESAKEWADQSQPLSNPSAGMSCIAKYSADDSFYRGEITSCSGSTCSITFIDYGNTEEINTNDVFPCLSSLAQIPCQAFQCSLLGITPVSGSDWGSDCLSKMEEMLADGGTCTFLARHGETFLVELAGNGEESVRDTLISSKLANANTKGSQASERSQGSQRSGSSGGYPKHVSMPSPARCIDAAGDAPPRKDLFHVSPATIQNLGVRKEESISGNIVHIETSREIYCQLSKSKSDVDSLYDIMGVFYHAGKGAVVDSIVKGSCYVAQFPDDKEWYRVRVTDVERDNVKVKYIDYGNSGVVSASAVRQLTADFSKLPAQALCCSLFNYTEVLDAKDLAVFTNAYLFSDVTGEIKGEEGEVVMVDMMCAGKPVSQLLQTGSSHSTPNRPQPCLKFAERQIAVGELEGYLVFEVSQQQFYIQLASDTQVLESVGEQLVDLSATSKPLSNPTVGQACIAKFSDDGQWYRAEVVNHSLTEGTDVLFIDYGNSSCVNGEDLLEISAELADIPRLAICCSLVAPQPSQSLLEWATDLLTVVVEKIDGSTAMVSLSMVGVPFAPVSTSCADAESPDNNSHHSTPDRPQPCLKFAERQIAVGKLEGYLVFEVSQQQFYIQLVSDTQVLESVGEQLVDLSATSKPLSNPTVGQACIAKFSDDGQWYRAEVVNHSLTEGTDVLFIDYGNSSCVNGEDLLEISAELADIPRLAICCSLVAPQPSQSLLEWATDLLTVVVEKIDGSTAMVSLSMVGVPFAPVSTNCTDAESPDNNSHHSTPDRPQPCLKFAERQTAVGELEGYLVFEVSQQQFYIQLASDTQVLESVGEQLVDLSATSKPLSNPTVGQACIAKFSDDGQWYRAEVVNHSLTEGTDVLFIDYGNSSCVNGEDLLEISAELADIPRLAICCSLVAPQPSQSLSEWATELIRISVSNCHHGIAHVTLTDADGNGFTSGGDVSLVAVESSLSSITLSASHLQSPLSNTSAAHSSCNSSPARSPLVSLPQSVVKPGTHNAYISHIDPVSGIYYVQLSENSLLLDEITEQLAHLGPSAEPEVYSPVGQACMAVYSEDQCYYRAVVSELHEEKGTSTLVYIDYGTGEEVTNSSLKVLPVPLRIHSPLAFKCTTNQSALTEMPTDQLITMLECKQWSVQIDGHTEPYNLVITDLQVSGGAEGIGKSLPSLPPSSTVCVDISPTRVLKCTRDEEIMISPIIPELQSEQTGLDVEDPTLSSICSDEDTAVQAVPVDVFCAELCADIKRELLASAENRTAYLSDKVNEFVHSLSEALRDQVEGMKQEEKGECTAQEVVSYVSHRIICDILDKPPPQPLDASLSDKNTMMVEIQNIVSILLEEILKMNYEIVEHMCEEGAAAVDTLVASGGAPALVHYLSPMSSQTSTSSNALESSESVTTSLVPSGASEALDVVVASPTPSGDDQGQPDGLVTSPAPSSDDRAPSSIVTSPAQSGEEGAPGSAITSPAHRGDDRELVSVSTSSTPSGEDRAPGSATTSPMPSGEEGAPGSVVTSPAPSRENWESGSVDASLAPSVEEGAPGSEVTSPTPSGEEGASDSVVTSPAPSGEEGAPGSVVTSSAPSRENGESGSVDTSLAPSVEEGAPGGEVASPTPSGDEKSPDIVTTSPATSSANRDISVGVTVSSGGDRAISDRNNASESCEQPLPSVTEVSSGTAQPVNGDGE